MKKNEIPPTRGRDSMGLLNPRDVPRACSTPLRSVPQRPSGHPLGWVNPFSLILSYLSHTPFINGHQWQHENIHTQASAISTWVSMAVCFSYSPPLRGWVWKTHCHTHPRSGGEYEKYTVLLTPATRVSMTVYFSYSLRSINQVEALEHHSAYEYINHLNSIEHQPGYCCLEHHSAYNWL